MSLSMNFHELMMGNDGAFRSYHPFSKSEKGFVLIPDRYRELFVDHFDDLDEIPFSDKTVEHLIQLYVSSFWLDQWYQGQDFTPKTEFYALKDEREVVVIFKEGPKFARLNSVSAKGPIPVRVTSLSEAREALLKSNRCRNLIDICDTFSLPAMIAIRDFIALESGNEYRVFIYKDKITAICSNDYKLPNVVSESMLVDRIRKLFRKALDSLPFQDCIMDVFLSSEDAKMTLSSSLIPLGNGQMELLDYSIGLKMNMNFMTAM